MAQRSNGNDKGHSRGGGGGGNSRPPWKANFIGKQVEPKRDMLNKDMLQAGFICHAKPKKISHIRFSMLSGAEMVRSSELQVSSRQLYSMTTREPMANGVLDGRLGISDKTSTCETCRSVSIHPSMHASSYSEYEYARAAFRK
jgi:hypothetical protein